METFDYEYYFNDNFHINSGDGKSKNEHNGNRLKLFYFTNILCYFIWMCYYIFIYEEDQVFREKGK